jgi:hypothetical protein
MAYSDYSRVQRPKGSMSFNAWGLVALIIVGFGILHVIGGIALRNTSGTSPTETQSAAIHRD